LILDGHGFHITIQALEKAVEVGLGMVTLLAHTSHTATIGCHQLQTIQNNF
jgi:hypothetical protein